MSETGFLPRALKEKLSIAKQAAVSILVSPSGYGKTTALKALRDEVGRERFHYISAAAVHTDEAWVRLAREVDRFDPRKGQCLKPFLPDGHNGGDGLSTSAGVRSCGPDGDWFLAIDDFHSVLDRLLPQVLGTLLNHNRPRLHVLLAGRYFEQPLSTSYDAYAINWISAGDMVFTPRDIRDFYSGAGIALSDTAAQTLHQGTQGWAAALAWALRVTEQTGTLPELLRLDRLLGQVFFNRLNPQERILLMVLGQMNEVSYADLHALGEDVGGRERAVQRLRSVPMIPYDTDRMVFVPHPIMKEFLSRRLREAGEELRREVHARLGRCLQARGDVIGAIAAYYENRDYDAILSLDIQLLSYERIGERSFEQIARGIVDDCPLEIKRAHPISLLRIAYALYGAGDRSGYWMAMNQAAAFIRREEEPELYGEWLLTSMLGQLPDIGKVHETMKQAARLLTNAPRAIARKEPFMFGCPSMWYLLYHTPGKGEEIILQLRAWLKDYTKLMGGRGMGADVLFEGELRSVQCRYEEAEALAFMAIEMSQGTEDPTVAFGAAMLMARNAIAMRDLDKAHLAIISLEKRALEYPALQGTAILRFMLDTTRSMILSMMLEHNMADERIAAGSRTVQGNSVMTRMTLHVRVLDLVIAERSDLALAVMNAALADTPALGATAEAQVINTALGMHYASRGNWPEAVKHLDIALTLCSEDRIVSMFVHHRELLAALLKNPALARHRTFINEILHGYTSPAKRAGLGRRTLSGDALPNDLSPREREVAVLAASGLRNSEIAGKLFVTESTIKKHMQTIFEKLDIDRRSKLVEWLSS